MVVGEFCLSHVIPQYRTGKSIARKIFKIIKHTPLEEKLKVYGSDRKAVIAGSKKGFKTKFGQSLQWVICLLHLNELMLQHVFQMLEGHASGPNTFSGSIGKKWNGFVSE